MLENLWQLEDTFRPDNLESKWLSSFTYHSKINNHKHFIVSCLACCQKWFVEFINVTQNASSYLLVKWKRRKHLI